MGELSERRQSSVPAAPAHSNTKGALKPPASSCPLTRLSALGFALDLRLRGRHGDRSAGPISTYGTLCGDLRQTLTRAIQ